MFAFQYWANFHLREAKGDTTDEEFQKVLPILLGQEKVTEGIHIYFLILRKSCGFLKLLDTSKFEKKKESNQSTGFNHSNNNSEKDFSDCDCCFCVLGLLHGFGHS